MMLSDMQKKLIEDEYRDYRAMAEHGHCTGILFVLETIGEKEFKKYLEETHD